MLIKANRTVSDYDLNPASIHTHSAQVLDPSRHFKFSAITMKNCTQILRSLQINISPKAPTFGVLRKHDHLQNISINEKCFLQQFMNKFHARRSISLRRILS